MNEESKEEGLTRIIDSLDEVLKEHFVPTANDDKEAELEATTLIRELRQIIERLRRIVDDGEPNEDAEDARIYRMVDVWKLPKDVLVKAVWEFLQWHKSEDGECPLMTCKDYPCHYKKQRKEELAENLENGDLDQETYDKYMSEINNDAWDCDEGEGCWASYYVWCYLNGYNPLNGKQEAK